MADGRDSGGIYAILVVVVVLLVLIILFMTGVLGGRQPAADPGPDLDVRIETPEAPSPTPPQN